MLERMIACISSRLLLPPCKACGIFRFPVEKFKLARTISARGRALCEAFSSASGSSRGPYEDSEDEADALPKRPTKWMIVGLGNPGTKFQGTRHNVGFEAIDYLALQENIKLNSIQCKALVGKGQIEGTPVLLVKPQTYMNLSGESVSPLALYYKIPPENLLVIFDDMDLDVALMKLQEKGSGGGHNGMKHIIERFKNNKNIPRLRIGIGRPPGSMEGRAYVLQKFTSREREEIDICIAKVADAVRRILSDGLTKAVSQWNPPRRSRDPTRTASAEDE